MESSSGATHIGNYFAPLGLNELTIIKSINISPLWDCTSVKNIIMKKFFLHITCIIIATISFSAKAQNKISVTNLQCEMPVSYTHLTLPTSDLV